MANNQIVNNLIWQVNNIISDLNNISSGIRQDFENIGNDTCASRVDDAIWRMGQVKELLESMDVNKLDE